MRIIGRIGHPSMQITVFSNDGRFPVQFELNGQTQIYRFRHSETMRGLGDIRELVDAEFASGVLRQFTEMRRLQSEVLERHGPVTDDELTDFPDII